MHEIIEKCLVLHKDPRPIIEDSEIWLKFQSQPNYFECFAIYSFKHNYVIFERCPQAIEGMIRVTHIKYPHIGFVPNIFWTTASAGP